MKRRVFVTGVAGFARRAGSPAPRRRSCRSRLSRSTEMKKPASLVAAIVFWLIALAQLLRVLFRVEVKAGGLDIPLWPSVLAVIVFGL